MSELEKIAEYFRVDDDQKAEWCLRKIAEAEEERAAWKAHYEAQMNRVNAACDETVATMKTFLRDYFDSVPHKVTKTEESYRLPSGKLCMKKREPDFQYDDGELLEWLKANQGEAFIKTVEKPDWSALKKTLTVVGETVADAEGQIIPCVHAVEREPEFKIAK